jgi:integration host factor subunit alpha
MTLTKSHIIEAISEANGFTRNKASDTVETVLEIIKSTLVSGDDVLVSRFGKFQVNHKSERRGRKQNRHSFAIDFINVYHSR